MMFRAWNISVPNSSPPTFSSALNIITGYLELYLSSMIPNSSSAPGISALLQIIIVGFDVYGSISSIVPGLVPMRLNPHSASSENDSSV